MELQPRIWCLFICCTFSLLNSTEAQNIRNDTIYVNTESAVELVFRSRSDGKLPQGDGSFEVKDGTNTSLVIRALKKEVADQPLEVTEGKRMHKFILSYKDAVPANRIDWSDLRKLKAYVSEKDKKVSKDLDEANKLFDQAKSDLNNEALWNNLAHQYLRLANAVDPKDAAMVKSRLDESLKQVNYLKEKKFDLALKEGQNYHSLKKYDEARKAYGKAREINPENGQLLQYISLNDSVWAKEYVDKGDEASKSKKYVVAKANYQEAMGIKPDYPFLQAKYNQAKRDADPLIYKNEKEKGDQAFKVDDIEGARRAYDSALSVRPGDPDLLKRIDKLVVEERIIEEEQKKVAAYDAILQSAKSLADKASRTQEYDLAIKEYQRARAIIPTRKFPNRKIDELTNRKNGLRPNQ